jgi:ABC-type phosphate transport system permease subunit
MINVYRASLAFLICHELDAVRNQEWTMLPLLSFLPNDIGYHVFTLLHVPIFTLVLIFYRRPLFRKSIDYFQIFHCGLHILALWCPRNQFTSVTSWILISGSMVCAVCDLVYARYYKGFLEE